MYIFISLDIYIYISHIGDHLNLLLKDEFVSQVFLQGVREIIVGRLNFLESMLKETIYKYRHMHI